MGFIDSILCKILGARWECDRCGKRYRNEPNQCDNCENTIYNRINR